MTLDATPKPIPVGQEPPPLRPPTSGTNDRPTAPRRGQRDRAKGSPRRRQTADRFAVLNAFVDAGMAGLSKAEALTWLVLYRDTRDGTACTSMESVANRIGCSRRAVMNAVQRLRRRGLLVQVFQGNNLRGPSRYRVLPLPRPPKGT